VKLNAVEFERDPFISVVSMSAEQAKDFLCPTAFKVVCIGQADPSRYRFGARRYRIFPTAQDWATYCRHRPEYTE